ncbi:hypothetical protein PVAP13_9NG142873 [Panicum virgatum]|uniref:Uncharacterized protein n=1 Tax=Panicum virgatum TaxID=38727 RepID=A0A8T0ML08_PANVG|nr:hypothetical protein PVAP13_9NG142873 [Panicum virgatum]
MLRSLPLLFSPKLFTSAFFASIFFSCSRWLLWSFDLGGYEWCQYWPSTSTPLPLACKGVGGGERGRGARRGALLPCTAPRHR